MLTPVPFRFVIEGSVDPALLDDLGALSVTRDGADTVLAGDVEVQVVLDRLTVHDLTLLGLQAYPD
jgi:hypothetical protein